jgi:hypothetical protein
VATIDAPRAAGKGLRSAGRGPPWPGTGTSAWPVTGQPFTQDLDPRAAAGLMRQRPRPGPEPHPPAARPIPCAHSASPVPPSPNATRIGVRAPRQTTSMLHRCCSSDSNAPSMLFDPGPWRAATVTVVTYDAQADHRELRVALLRPRDGHPLHRRGRALPGITSPWTKPAENAGFRSTITGVVTAVARGARTQPSEPCGLSSDASQQLRCAIDVVEPGARGAARPPGTPPVAGRQPSRHHRSRAPQLSHRRPGLARPPGPTKTLGVQTQSAMARAAHPAQRPRPAIG